MDDFGVSPTPPVYRPLDSGRTRYHPPFGPDWTAGWTTSHRRPHQRVAILLPALNEEKGIVQVIKALPSRKLRKAGFDPHVLVLDGKSTDGTRARAEEMGATVLVQPGEGKADAFRSAIPQISAPYAVMLDADGTYPTKVIPEMVKLLEHGFDVVSGSRFSGTIEDGAMSGVNKIGNRILTWLATSLFPRSPTTDVCTGLWAFRTSALRAMRLDAEGFSLEADLYAELASKGFRYTEIPIDYVRREGETKLSWKHGFEIAATLLRKKLAT